MLLVSTKQKCDLGEMLESCVVKTIPAAFFHDCTSNLAKYDWYIIFFLLVLHNFQGYNEINFN